jgi:hypothetical protein
VNTQGTRRLEHLDLHGNHAGLEFPQDFLTIFQRQAQILPSDEDPGPRNCRYVAGFDYPSSQSCFDVNDKFHGGVSVGSDVYNPPAPP